VPVVARPRGARWTRTANAVADRDRWRCVRCRRRVYRYDGGGSFPDSLHVDHVKPVSRGGDWWDPKNLQTLCRDCNIRKGANVIDYRWRTRARRWAIRLGIVWCMVCIAADQLARQVP
jgi:5-methylcytosine-specific restriction endonuclease McrA